MNTLIRSLFLASCLAGVLQANDPRVLEITGDARNRTATVEFLADKTGELSLKTYTTVNKSFVWFDIPEEAKAARIKVGELATLPFELGSSGTTLVEVGTPTVATTQKGLSVAVLGTTVTTDRAPAKVDLTGWVYFGCLDSAAPSASSAEAWTWKSLYVVRPPNVPLDLGNAGTKSVVESLAKGNLLRADFPLILRQAGADGSIARSKEDPGIRAGQYVLVSNFKEPDAKGNVYAEVKVIAAPSTR